MADFGIGRDKKTDDYDVGEKAKDHAVRLAGASLRVKDKSGLRRNADHRSGILSESLATAARDSGGASYPEIHFGLFTRSLA